MTVKTATHPLTKSLPAEGAMPFVTGLAVAAPCTLLSVVMMLRHISLPQPWLLTMGILVFGAADFFAILLLEPARRRIGRLTIPALLAACALVLAYVLAATFNRYVVETGYDWFLPFVIAALGLCYCGVFRERRLALKILLALNGLMLTVLWSLGDMGKVALPF